MTLLNDIYGITTPAQSGMEGYIYFPLNVPLVKMISLDPIEFDKIKDTNISIAWDFGDPFCDPSDNTHLSTSITDTIEHTYTYAGYYEINCVATINGTAIRLTEHMMIDPDELIDVIVPSHESGNYSLVNLTLSLNTYDYRTKIFYTVGSSSSEEYVEDFQEYTEPFSVVGDDIVLKYYGVFSDGTSGVIYTSTYSTNYVPAINYYVNFAPISSGPYLYSTTVTLTVKPSSAANLDVFYYTSVNSTPTLYTGPFEFTTGGIIYAFVRETISEDFVYDHPISAKTYIIEVPL